MRSTEIVFFCALYLLFFSVIGYLAGVAEFPPPELEIGIPGTPYSITLSFWGMTTLVTAISVIVVGVAIAGIKILGFGLEIDQAFMVTLFIALFVGLMLASTMGTMFVDIPTIISAVLVWPFVGVLIYSIISMARGGTGG